ncbi:unnamed protein product [Cuscuta campestris]|uniref:Uncharacterized protein n=1 Tax=Cuscuta campestris TaxID=132261 RepID=A0A484K7V6_9ASTE|nr:unnamed protein product [Cuscuta campestris]
MGKRRGFCCFGFWKRKKGSDDGHEREEGDDNGHDVAVANQYKVRPTDERDGYDYYCMADDPEIDIKATAFLNIKKQQLRNNGSSKTDDVSK